MKILVPISTGEISMNAFKYAFDMFDSAEIHCIMVDPEFDILKTKLEAKLKALMTKAIETTELPERVSLSILKNLIIPTLKTKADEIKPDFVVMGTRDKYDFMDRWLGTISIGIVKSLNYPTILVPRYARYHSIKKVLVATDHHLENKNLLDWIKNWNIKHNAFVNFVHVQDSNKRDIDRISENIVQNYFENSDAQFAFEITNIKSKNIADTLLDKAYNMGADLVLAAPDRQSFVSSLLLTSISKEMILKAKIPLLFLSFKTVDS